MKGLLLALMLLSQQPKEIKIYMNVANHGHSEMYALHVQTWLNILDEQDRGYELKWTPRAGDAEFIVTLVCDRDIETGKYMTMTHLYRKNSFKAFEVLNQQLNKDPDAIAERVAKVLEQSMGLKKQEVVKR